MKFPVKGKSGTEYDKEAYKALGVDAKRAEGFYTDPEVAYEMVEDKVESFAGPKQYTLDAVVGGEKIPVSTLMHGMQESHFNYNGVEVV